MLLSHTKCLLCQYAPTAFKLLQTRSIFSVPLGFTFLEIWHTTKMCWETSWIKCQLKAQAKHAYFPCKPSYLPAILFVSTVLYSPQISSSLSLTRRSHIMFTCLNVNRGTSFLLGESEFNSEVAEHCARLSVLHGISIEAGGGLLLVGYCSCLLRCIFFISKLMLAAMRSANRTKKKFTIFFILASLTNVNQAQTNILLHDNKLRIGMATYPPPIYSKLSTLNSESAINSHQL